MINEFKIVSMETGKTLAPLEVGEIVIRGCNVAQGYWNNPKATAESFDKDGWFKSGDLGYLDKESFLHIVDRAKEIIVRPIPRPRK